MKKTIINGLLVALPVILMVSCKPSLSVSSDYDRSANFSSYKTFSLYYLVTSRNVNELNEQRIWNSIRAEMIAKGYKENDQNPDLVVNAVSVLKNKKYVSASSSGYGYGGVYRPYGYWAGASGVAAGQTTFRAIDYKTGSLIIDVVDAKTKKLVWEGKGQADVEKQPKNPDAVIRDVVTKIMTSFPKGDAQKQ